MLYTWLELKNLLTGKTRTITKIQSDKKQKYLYIWSSILLAFDEFAYFHNKYLIAAK
jgi:hypothetical protein